MPDQSDAHPVSALVETTSTSVAWYDPEPGTRLTPEVRTFFDQYCGLTGESLLKHLHTVRWEAWQTRPYPCIGQWTFLQPKIIKSPLYPMILKRIRSGDSILDLGCCVGQDLRVLAAAGVPTDKMYASDIEPAFWKNGYSLFRDQETFKAKFIPADILEEDTLLESLNSQVDIVWAGSLIHLWNWSGQLKAIKAIIRLTKEGSIVAGAQIGRAEASEVSTGWKTTAKVIFYHDPQTFKELWSRAAAETSTSWTVDARFVDLKLLLPEGRDSVWMGDQARGLLFEAFRSPATQS